VKRTHETRVCADGKLRGCFKAFSYEEACAAFWAKIDRRGPKECWFWQGAKAEYGICSKAGKSNQAHRRAFELTNGPIPADKVVRHTCDRKYCCNPAHLILGTQAENVADAVKRGLFPKGARSGYRKHPERFPKGGDCVRAKLKVHQVRRLLSLYFLHGWNSKDLAEKFLISQTQVGRIVAAKSWKHLSDEFRKKNGKRICKNHRRNQAAAHARPLDEKLPEMRRLRKEGKSYDEIGAALSCSRNAVWKRLRLFEI
jgi:DNA invertase Pin-like site-specific DNA recombinase